MRERRWVVVAVVFLLGLAAGYLIWGRGSPTSPPSTSESAQGPSPSPTAAPSAKPATAASTGAEATREEPHLPVAVATARDTDGTSETDGAISNAAGNETTPSASVALFATVASDIEGEVDFTGQVPAADKLHREADPYCARTQIMDPTVLVKDGKLANVWVHVTKGAPDAPAPGQPVEIDQRNCMYVPRVVAAVVGQKIFARNGDPILHNVHAYLGASTVFNRGMPNAKAAPIEYVPNQEGVMKWKCDVHPWMRGYIGISRNNLQAVSGATGAFRIENVPPGRYTIEAWHEKYGAKAQEVTVRPGVPAKVTFKFDGTEKS